jgi:hypothetical protein
MGVFLPVFSLFFFLFYFTLGRCFPFSAALDFTGVFVFDVAFFVVVFAFGFRVAGFFGLMVLFSFNQII